MAERPRCSQKDSRPVNPDLFSSDAAVPLKSYRFAQTWNHVYEKVRYQAVDRFGESREVGVKTGQKRRAIHLAL